MGKELGEVFCKICGLSSNYDKNFHKQKELCNRHHFQIKRNGKPKDANMILPNSAIRIKKCCSVCGDTESVKYYIWKKGGEFQK